MWLRRFTFRKLREYYENQNKKSSGTTTDDLNEARSILQKAASNRPSQPSPKPPQPISNKIPDFTTSKVKASK